MRCAGPRRACLQLIDASQSAPPFLQSAPLSTAHPPHCVRQPSIPTMVCGGGGGARLCMQAHFPPPSPSVSPSASLSFTWLWQEYKTWAAEAGLPQFLIHPRISDPQKPIPSGE